MFLTVARQRSGWQSEVAVHGSAPGANRNNCEYRWEQARARTAWARATHGLRTDQVFGHGREGANEIRART
jgi:hypothetical protein